MDILKTKTTLVILFFGLLLPIGARVDALWNVSQAAEKISELDFENSLSDSFGRITAIGSPTGQTAEAQQITSYVPGRTGLSARSSHNNDDGAGDLTLRHPSDSWPASNELYEHFWLRYQPDYWGRCDNGIWNVKWLWSLGSTAHTELIFQSYDSANRRITLAWQLSGGGTGWDAGSAITKYGTFNYNFGDWMEVEIYIKLSSGAGHLNPDGVLRVKADGAQVINQTNVVTGVPGTITSPALKASCDCPAGQGWWQIDDYEVWDGLPNVEEDTISPAIPNSLSVR